MAYYRMDCENTPRHNFFDRFPDSLVLDILTYLHLPALLNVSRTFNRSKGTTERFPFVSLDTEGPVIKCLPFSVSRRFYRLTQDQRFWKRLDCTQFRDLVLNDLRKLLRRPSAIQVVSLRWEGYLRRSPSWRQSTRQAVTPSFLTELSQRCPNLRELHIIYANVDTVTLFHFPQSLEFLGFEGSVFPLEFFGPLNAHNVLPHLAGLDLNYCHGLSSHSRFSIPGILSRQRMTTLLLKHCYRVAVGDLALFPIWLRNLSTLNVSDLSVVDGNFVRLLAQYGSALQELDISFCLTIDAGVFRLLATSTVCRLRKLYAIETKIDDEALALLAQRQPQLIYLNIVKTACTIEGITEFYRRNSICRVEHKWHP